MKNSSLTPRERQEQWELSDLAPWASKAALSRGRVHSEEPDTVRTAFQRDRDRVLHSKAFRRLKHKTQVFIDPEEDHFRTRLTHTLEVSQIARTISRALRLNEDLTEAIALAHDLGHPPFGHAGEEALNSALKAFEPTKSFLHYEQSLRIVEFLETKTDDNTDTEFTYENTGLNLTWEVRDGIAHHSKGAADFDDGTPRSLTLEGQVMRIADRVAYINHDIDDAIRAGVIRACDLPAGPISLLGNGHSQRITRVVCDIVEQSEDRPEVRMSADVEKAMDELKDFMFERVYWNAASGNNDLRKAQHVIKALFTLYMENPEMMTGGRSSLADPVKARALHVCDFIAGMTDRYAVSRFELHFVPQSMRPITPSTF